MSNLFDLFKKIEQPAESAGAPEWIIVGLGNPGRDYEKTRHNAGFLAMGVLCEKLGAECRRARFRALTGTATVGGHRVLLMMPETYMNLSGESVREAADFYHIPPERVIVLVDDVYLAPGRMRIRTGGSNGGHNGLGNIICQLNSDRFARVRFGVGEKPHPNYDMKDWVLGKLSNDDLSHMKGCFDDTLDAVTLLMDGKADRAMELYNGKVH